MAAPEGYKKLPKGVRCRCIRLWQEPEAGGLRHYCCKGDEAPYLSEETINAPPADLEKISRVSAELHGRIREWQDAHDLRPSEVAAILDGMAAYFGCLCALSECFDVQFG